MNENITLPPGVILKSVVPQNVEVGLDVPVRKILPVQLDWVGKLSDHLILESATLEPERIQIIGGQRILEKMATIYTEKISLDAIKEPGTMKMTARVVLNPVSLKIASDSTDKIAVNFVVKKRL